MTLLAVVPRAHHDNSSRANFAPLMKKLHDMPIIVVSGSPASRKVMIALDSTQEAARGVPMRHAFLSTLGLLLMVAGWWLRRDDPTSVVAISLSGIAVVAMVASRRIGMRLTPAAPLRVTK